MLILDLQFIVEKWVLGYDFFRQMILVKMSYRPSDGIADNYNIFWPSKVFEAIPLDLSQDSSFSTVPFLSL